MPQPLNVLGGLDDGAAYKVTCACATTGDMTNTMIGLPVIDGYQTLPGDRVLVWQNTDQTTNGIYQVPGGPQGVGAPPPQSTGAWVRSLDFTNTDSVYQGTQVLVYNGTLYNGQVFVVTSPTGPTFGATPITFSPAQTSTAAQTAAAQASASAASASASAAAASAAAAGTGGVASLVIAGGTINLTTAQANAAILSLTGSLAADQFIDFPAGITNPRMVVLQGATVNGFTVYLRGNGGADVIGVWFPKIWLPPVSILITPTRVYWGGYESVAPGAYQNFPLNGIPPGWLPCDGASYSAALYDLLFAYLGTSQGGGGGNFNVPDDRGEVQACADNLGTGAGSAGRLNNYVVGVNGLGEATHTLIIGEMPNHSHTALTQGAGAVAGGVSAFSVIQPGGVTGSTGGNGAHNNIQPSRTVMRAIRF